jgi:hypothetical protein
MQFIAGKQLTFAESKTSLAEHSVTKMKPFGNSN